MKKTLSIIMALCMILSVCFFSVSAAEATVGSVAADYKPAEGVPTGDSSIIFAVVAIISLLGVATVAKRREN